MNGSGAKAAIWTGIGTFAVILVAGLFVWGLLYKPVYSSDRTAGRSVSASTLPTGQKAVTVHLNIVVQVSYGPHADWLGYQTPTNPPNPGTYFTVPAHSRVTIVVHNYDSPTGLRNSYLSLVQGTVGGVEYVNGKPVKLMNPNNISHTFTIPDLGVSVPMLGVGPNATSSDYQTMKFTFVTPGPGQFRFQCFVPCGSGLYGNGGPMSEPGYMSGIITVVA